MGWGRLDALGQLLVGQWLMHAALERHLPALPPLQGLVVPELTHDLGGGAEPAAGPMAHGVPGSCQGPESYFQEPECYMSPAA